MHRTQLLAGGWHCTEVAVLRVLLLLQHLLGRQHVVRLEPQLSTAFWVVHGLLQGRWQMVALHQGNPYCRIVVQLEDCGSQPHLWQPRALQSQILTRRASHIQRYGRIHTCPSFPVLHTQDNLQDKTRKCKACCQILFTQTRARLGWPHLSRPTC